MFYRLFNFLYKLTSRRGLKVFALTCVIIFIISFIIGVNQSHAFTQEDIDDYGSSLTYWKDIPLVKGYGYLRMITTSGGSGKQLEYYSGSDRKTWVFWHMQENHIYAVYNNTSSVLNYYWCYVDDIDSVPCKSGDSPLFVVGQDNGNSLISPIPARWL